MACHSPNLFAQQIRTQARVVHGADRQALLAAIAHALVSDDPAEADEDVAFLVHVLHQLRCRHDILGQLPLELAEKVLVYQ